jgi:hypothetical protein
MGCMHSDFQGFPLTKRATKVSPKSRRIPPKSARTGAARPPAPKIARSSAKGPPPKKPAAPSPASLKGRPLLAQSEHRPAREPEGAERLKLRIAELAKRNARVKELKRSLQDRFYEIGELLADIETERLYDCKGYRSLEDFLDRESGLGRDTGMTLVRIARTFRREAAESIGLRRLTVLLTALDADEVAPAAAPAKRIR